MVAEGKALIEAKIYNEKQRRNQSQKVMKVGVLNELEAISAPKDRGTEVA